MCGTSIACSLSNNNLYFPTQNCTHKFDEAAEDLRFRFFGNVNVGDPQKPIPHTVQLPLASVFKNYTHVLFATGCTLPTLHSALPPTSYCIPALSLVHWYTQHPSRPLPPPLEKLSHVSLIGNGNVSLDIARILLTSVSVLEKYDVPTSVLDLLSRSQVKHVSIFGRRGPLEAAFTMKELREMINLPEASMVPIEPALLEPIPDVPLTRQQSRILQLLKKGSKNTLGTTPKSWSLDFFRSPTNLSPPMTDSSLARLTLAHTTVDPTHARAIPTGDSTTITTSMVVTSLGFHGEPASSFYDPALGHLRSVSGRIVSSSGRALKNVYASGWAATGAKGVLASTMLNAYAVADTILSDWMPEGELVSTTPTSPPSGQSTVDDDIAEIVLSSNPHPENPPQEILDGMKDGLVTEYQDWKKIDAEEVRRGEILGKERERMEWAEAQAFLSSREPLQH
jgi:adrenodoxin-NADP+ reductase